MTISDRFAASLAQAWELQGDSDRLAAGLPPEVVAAIEVIMSSDSPPSRQILLTIAAATASEPESNAASIQLPAGVDRRGQAMLTRDVLAAFVAAHGLTLKLSKDPGVSNPWRTAEIDQAWVDKRRNAWARAFLEIVTWLNESPTLDLKAQNSQLVLEYSSLRLVEFAVGNALNYPKFQTNPSLAMLFVEQLVASAPNRPDAVESVVTAAARVVARVLDTELVVTRGDVNSPDAIDIRIESPGGDINSGIEVTDDPITLAKLEHEVLPAMLKYGLDRATVVSRGVSSADAKAIAAWQRALLVKFGQRVDIVDLSIIESWLSFPATPKDLATRFVREIGVELDTYSSDANRRAWLEVLTSFTEEALAEIKDQEQT